MADPHFANVVLLCRFDTSITDESNSAHTLTVTGSPSISSAQSVAGGSSLLVTSSSTNRANLITTPVSSDFAFDGDFTVEMWVRPTGQGNTYMSALSTVGSDSSAGSIQFGRRMDTNGLMAYVLSADNAWSDGTGNAGALPFNTWSHIALERHGSTVRVYLDGAVGATIGTAISNTIGRSQLEIGCGDIGTTNRDWQGYIDELRITKGVARYQGASFTPPSGTDFDEGGTPTMGEARTTAGYRETMTADPSNLTTTAGWRETLMQGGPIASTAGWRETLMSRAVPATTAGYRETLYSRAAPATTSAYREVLRSTALGRTGLRKRSANLTWDTLIELVEIDLRSLGSDFRLNADAEPGIVRVSPNWSGDDLVALQGAPLVFRGLKFWPSALAAEGFSWSIRDQLPRPTLHVADMDGALLVEATELDDLIGATVKYWATDVNFLDFVPGTDTPADPATGDAYGPEEYVVNKLLLADGFQLQWELIALLDQPNRLIPGRRMLRREFPGLGR